jgi:hypothetical protein
MKMICLPSHLFADMREVLYLLSPEEDSSVHSFAVMQVFDLLVLTPSSSSASMMTSLFFIVP